MNFETKTVRAQVGELDGLVQDAERVLKYVQEFANELYLPALNEWRYATGHLSRCLSSERHQVAPECELDKAICHMRRAYYDGVLLLMECFAFRAYRFCRSARQLMRRELIQGPGLDEIEQTLRDVLIARQKISMTSLDQMEGGLSECRSMVNRIVTAYAVINTYMPLLILYERRSRYVRILLTVVCVMAGVIGGRLIWLFGKF